MRCSKLFQAMSKMTEAHLQATKRLFQYFQETQGNRIVFGKPNSRIIIPMWMQDEAAEIDLKSIFKSWVHIREIFKQREGKELATMVAMTAVEAELGTVAEAVKEVIWWMWHWHRYLKDTTIAPNFRFFLSFLRSARVVLRLESILILPRPMFIDECIQFLLVRNGSPAGMPSPAVAPWRQPRQCGENGQPR